MKTCSFRSYWLISAVVGIVFAVANPAAADDDKGKGKGKDKDAKPNTVTIDLNKLPPELVKELLKYALEGKVASAATKPVSAKPDTSAVKLPPGLAKKPKDHPGVVAFLRQHGGNQAAPSAKKKDDDKKKEDDKKKKKKGKDDDDDDDD